MSSNLIIPEKLEQLFLQNWAEFVDKTALIRRVLADARDADLQVVNGDPPTSQLKLTITRFHLVDNTKFEVWIEFAIPKDGGMIVGSHVYLTECSGDFQLQDTYGVIFQTQSS